MTIKKSHFNCELGQVSLVQKKESRAAAQDSNQLCRTGVHFCLFFKLYFSRSRLGKKRKSIRRTIFQLVCYCFGVNFSSPINKRKNLKGQLRLLQTKTQMFKFLTKSQSSAIQNTGDERDGKGKVIILIIINDSIIGAPEWLSWLSDSWLQLRS